MVAGSRDPPTRHKYALRAGQKRGSTKEQALQRHNAKAQPAARSSFCLGFVAQLLRRRRLAALAAPAQRHVDDAHGLRGKLFETALRANLSREGGHAHGFCLVCCVEPTIRDKRFRSARLPQTRARKRKRRAQKQFRQKPNTTSDSATVRAGTGMSALWQLLPTSARNMACRL